MGRVPAGRGADPAAGRRRARTAPDRGRPGPGRRDGLAAAPGRAAHRRRGRGGRRGRAEAAVPRGRGAAGDATALTFEDGTFDVAATFTMLHHVPTRAGQDQLLAELVRVVRPGGVVVGADSLASDGLRDIHADDTYN